MQGNTISLIKKIQVNMAKNDEKTDKIPGYDIKRENTKTHIHNHPHTRKIT